MGRDLMSVVVPTDLMIEVVLVMDTSKLSMMFLAGSNSTGIVKIINTTCTGTQTESLTRSTDTVGIQTFTCVLTHPTATNSPLTSDTALFSLSPMKSRTH